SFAIEAHLEENAAVDMLLDDGKITLAPMRSQRPSLKELLAQVSDANLHSEVETGPAAGREAW
ncbi:MAG TPA: AbrB/MazE/SpoVT family DNA-binding domain-containing protein, partial [Chloroflexota bacterium]|nr:AbrB/MazE/SpoVT family DNA-binding domain-containing protein [Chloroflexota bacterium]